MSEIETHSAREAPAGGRALSAVGVSEAEEGTYLLLLERPGATLAEIADHLGLSKRRSRRLLASLEAKGMVTRSLGGDTRFQPIPPETAVEALITQQQRQLNAVRWHAERLAEQARSAVAQGGGQEVVEMLTGADAVTRCWERLYGAVERESFILLRSPATGPEHDRVGAAKGVAVRAIYDREALEWPGALEGLGDLVAAGEQTRVFSPVPVEMVIVDRRAAMIPLVSDVPGAMALLLRPSGLLNALTMFFDMIWQRATPFTLTAAGEIQLHDAVGEQLPADVERILPLLAIGLRDDSIARELGISARTLDRRVRAMMRALNAATRFQAGWLAAGRCRAVDQSEAGQQWQDKGA